MENKTQRVKNFQFFSFLTSSEKGLDFSDQWRFVVEATKTSKRKKNTLELHYRVWSEQPELERVKSFGVAGGVSVELFDKIYRTFYFEICLSIFLFDQLHLEFQVGPKSYSRRKEFGTVTIGRH